jgi:hypothetical protein
MKHSRLISGTAMLLAILSGAAEAGPPDKGHAFPLSGGVAPTLISIEVHHVASDNTIDVAVSLTPPDPPPASDAELLTQLGEFCLRYEAEVVAAAIPAASDRARIYGFVPLFRVPVSDRPNEFQEAGFDFRVLDGKCSLGTPFPPALVDAVRARAAGPTR